MQWRQQHAVCMRGRSTAAGPGVRCRLGGARVGRRAPRTAAKWARARCTLKWRGAPLSWADLWVGWAHRRACVRGVLIARVWGQPCSPARVVRRFRYCMVSAWPLRCRRWHARRRPCCGQVPNSRMSERVPQAVRSLWSASLRARPALLLGKCVAAGWRLRLHGLAIQDGERGRGATALTTA